ncbi:MAG: DUF1616 domain-containing protein [Candidatus Bathyarchaeia archaeon]
MAIVVVVGVFAVAQPYYASRVFNPISELAVLGPDRKMGDYPKAVKAGEELNLYIFVANHEGQSNYYRVYAKLGNRSTVPNENVPLAVEPMAMYEVILRDNQTWFEPVMLQIGLPGTDYRLVFELWKYRPEEDTFVYDHKWVQLWLEVKGDE